MNALYVSGRDRGLVEDWGQRGGQCQRANRSLRGQGDRQTLGTRTSKATTGLYFLISIYVMYVYTIFYGFINYSTLI